MMESNDCKWPETHTVLNKVNNMGYLTTTTRQSGKEYVVVEFAKITIDNFCVKLLAHINARDKIVFLQQREPEIKHLGVIGLNTFIEHLITNKEQTAHH